MSLSWWLYLSSLLFAIGASAVLVRRNAIIVFMGVELMLNATNLAFVTFARMRGDIDGQVIALFVMLVAAAEVVVGRAIIMTIFRTRRSASVDDADLLKHCEAIGYRACSSLRLLRGSVPRPGRRSPGRRVDAHRVAAARRCRAPARRAPGRPVGPLARGRAVLGRVRM